MFLAAHRWELFDDSSIADLFGSPTGRPSLPADRLRGDVRHPPEGGLWLVAGRDVAGWDALVYWRRRVAASDRPDRVFDTVAEVVAQTGILIARCKRCVDSTVFADAVATHDTATQLGAAIRRVARTVLGAGEVVAAVCMVDHPS